MMLVRLCEVMLRVWTEDISCEGGAGHYRTEDVY